MKTTAGLADPHGERESNTRDDESERDQYDSSRDDENDRPSAKKHDAESSSSSSSVSRNGDGLDHGEPDIDHEEVEAATAGHELDVELERTRDLEALARIESRGSLTYRISRVLSTASRRGTEEKSAGNSAGAGLHDAVPVSDLDAGIVGWDGLDDPEMPMNMPANKKWLYIGVLAALTFLTTFASSILSPGVSHVNSEFHNDSATISSMIISVYLLGYVVGPLFMAPLSEIYGRKPVLSAASVFFCVWQMAVALAPNIDGLIVFRFFGGVGGAACMTLSGSVAGDIFRTEQRGLAIGIWNIGALFGPTMGPLLGGFLAETIGWRWDFWIVLATSVVLAVLLYMVGPETNPRVLMQRKVARLARELGRGDLKSCYAVSSSSSSSASLSATRILLNGLMRPTKMLFLSPMIFFLSLYMAYVYGVMYLLFTTIPSVFEKTYGFTVGMTGLVYLSLGFSNTVGWLVITLYSDQSVIRLTMANGGRFEPEMRLALTICFGAFLPVSFFWYGWTAYFHVHWISPILALMPFGFGMMGVFLPISTYLVDAYALYSASAMAANVVLRSLVGALLPLAGPSMYASLGYGWGNSVLGFISIGMIPVPVLIYKYGERLRKAQKFQL